MNSEEFCEKLRHQTDIAEFFNCYICFGKVKNPVMCPFCSKLCCAHCVNKWLDQRNQCPHCRCTLLSNQLVNCRFVSELTAAIDNITKSSTNSTESSCSIHSQPLLYFCILCSKSVCSDCAMFGDHKGHQFEKLQTIYDNHVANIKEQSTILHTRLEEMHKYMEDIEDVISRVTKAKEEKANEINTVMEKIYSRLDSQLKSKLLQLINHKSSMIDEIDYLENVEQEINREMTKAPKSQLVLRSSELISTLKEVQNKPGLIFSKDIINIDFESELVPEFSIGVFEIINYNKIRFESEIIYSKELISNGLVWRLKVYPNGNGIAKGSYLSVFLEMLSGVTTPTKYEYKVELINHVNTTMSVIREFASDFEANECWGYNRFFRIDNLNKDGYINQINHSLVLKFHVRAPTFAQQCKNQTECISQQDRICKELRVEIESLKLDLKSKNNELNEYKNEGDCDIERASPDIIIGSEGEVGEERKSVSGKEVMEEEKGGETTPSEPLYWRICKSGDAGEFKESKESGEPPAHIMERQENSPQTMTSFKVQATSPNLLLRKSLSGSYRGSAHSPGPQSPLSAHSPGTHSPGLKMSSTPPGSLGEVQLLATLLHCNSSPHMQGGLNMNIQTHTHTHTHMNMGTHSHTHKYSKVQELEVSISDSDNQESEREDSGRTSQSSQRSSGDSWQSPQEDPSISSGSGGRRFGGNSNRAQEHITSPHHMHHNLGGGDIEYMLNNEDSDSSHHTSHDHDSNSTPLIDLHPNAPFSNPHIHQDISSIQQLLPQNREEEKLQVFGNLLSNNNPNDNHLFSTNDEYDIHFEGNNNHDIPEQFQIKAFEPTEKDFAYLNEDYLPLAPKGIGLLFKEIQNNQFDNNNNNMPQEEQKPSDSCELTANYPQILNRPRWKGFQIQLSGQHRSIKRSSLSTADINMREFKRAFQENVGSREHRNEEEGEMGGLRPPRSIIKRSGTNHNFIIRKNTDPPSSSISPNPDSTGSSPTYKTNQTS